MNTIAKVFIALLTIFGLVFVGDRLFDAYRDAYLVREVAKLELPRDARLVFKDEVWMRFGSEGSSVRVYEIPGPFAGMILDDCRSVGYMTGPYASSGMTVPPIERYMTKGKSCYLLKREDGGFQLSVVNDDFLVIYVNL